MRTVKKLLIVMILLFVSGCSDIETNQSNESSSQAQSFEVSSVQPSESEEAFEYPPSDWPNEPIVTHREDNGKILYQEGISSDRFWTEKGLECLKYLDQEFMPSKNPLVPNKETAITIATAIFNAQVLIEGWDTKNMVVGGVFYDTQDEVWIVAFSYSNARYVDYATGHITMTLRKDNAQVLAIWAEAG